MSKLFRFGVSLERRLLAKFDRLIKEKGYTSRSQALADLIRRDLVNKEWLEDEEIVGVITLIYNHHKRELLNKITDIQHKFQRLIISTQHIHLDHNNCLEIIAVKGASQDVGRLSDVLTSVKGVKHGALTMSSTGRGLC